MTPELKRRYELRRVISIAGAFARNLAYYETMWDWRFFGLFFGRKEKGPLQLNFWMVANRSFLQTAILEWAKLLGSSKTEKHHWRKVVSDPDGFESSLLAELSISKNEYEAARKILLHYRNKIVAHLDPQSGFRMVPQMTVAKASVWHYVKHLFQHDIKGDEVANLAESFEAFDSEFERRKDDARAIFWSVQGFPYPMPPTDPEGFKEWVLSYPEALGITDPEKIAAIRESRQKKE